MKKLIISAGIIGFIVLQGCSSDNTKETGTDAVNTEQSLNLPENMSTDSQQTNVTEPSGNISEQNANPSVPVSTAKGMNPEHGQPGHRCDIAVGAPLNSPPGKTANDAPTMINAQPNTPSSPNISVQPPSNPGQPQIIQSTPPTGPTPPGMNPPHGEPGHDCSIAVGAPLKK